MTNSLIRLTILSASVLTLQSCSTRFHPQFGASEIATDVYAVVTNDSLGLQVKAPSDIQFYTDEKEAQKFLRKEWELNRPENILLVGKTKVDPNYSFILVMDTPSELHHRDFSGIRIHAFERVISGHRFNLIAHGEKPNIRPDDFLFILDNLKIQ